MHFGQPKPYLEWKRTVLSVLGGLLEILGLEVMAEGVRAGTNSEGWRQRVPDCRSCDVETRGRQKRCGQTGWKADWHLTTQENEWNEYVVFLLCASSFNVHFAPL